jgi:hypothetical protein
VLIVGVCRNPYLAVIESLNQSRKRLSSTALSFDRACLEQRRHFSPFVVSADGLLGKEAKILLRKLSAMLATKWEKPYSEVCGYGNARMSIAIVRAAHLCIRGSRIPTGKMRNRLPQWEENAGLGLFRH